MISFIILLALVPRFKLLKSNNYGFLFFLTYDWTNAYQLDSLYSNLKSSHLESYKLLISCFNFLDISGKSVKKEGWVFLIDDFFKGVEIVLLGRAVFSLMRAIESS